MDTYQTTNISYTEALKWVSKACEIAAEQKFALACCVVDTAGRVVAKVVMDGAAVIADELVEKKAKAALLGLSTHDMAKAMESALPQAISLVQLEGFTLMAGGAPIMQEGRTIGAVAIGGATEDQDEQCLQQLLAAFNA